MVRLLIAAIEGNKHTVIEYPLSLNPQEASTIIALAQAKNKLIHVEHIELIGGIHQTLKKYLPEIGNISYARYTTIAPKHPAPRRWNYHRQMWGFSTVGCPFSGSSSNRYIRQCGASILSISLLGCS